jgi:hypothetical protein
MFQAMGVDTNALYSLANSAAQEYIASQQSSLDTASIQALTNLRPPTVTVACDSAACQQDLDNLRHVLDNIGWVVPTPAPGAFAGFSPVGGCITVFQNGCGGSGGGGSGSIGTSGSALFPSTGTGSVASTTTTSAGVSVGTAVGIAVAFGLGPWVLLGAYMYAGPYLKPWLQGLAERAKAWQQQAAQEEIADEDEEEEVGTAAEGDAEAPSTALGSGPMRFSRVTNLSSSDSDNY